MQNSLKAGPYISFVFLLIVVAANGQRNFDDGYVITNKNDTLYGQVSDRKSGPFGGIYGDVRFRGERGKRKYRPKDIKEYKIGKTIFRSEVLDDEIVFLKLKAEGAVTHYVFELQEQGEEMILDIDYLVKNDDSHLVRATQGIFGLKRKRLALYFNDCPQLVEKIQNKEFKYVFEVVDFYNTWKRSQKTY